VINANNQGMGANLPNDRQPNQGFTGQSSEIGAGTFTPKGQNNVQ
jgi:hypothetical protein